LGSEEYTIQSPISPPADEVEHEDTGATTHFSSRIHDTTMEDMRREAEILSRKRNLEGNHTPADSNSFSVLSSSEIVVRASMMGAKIPDNKFSSIDLLGELECAREILENKQMHSVNDIPLFIENNVGEMTPLCMNWSDENEENGEGFILVESRKERRNKRSKSHIVVSRPITGRQKVVVREANKSAHTPGRNIRERKQNSKSK
jgi:hypothetical protein